MECVFNVTTSLQRENAQEVALQLQVFVGNAETHHLILMKNVMMGIKMKGMDAIQIVISKDLMQRYKMLLLGMMFISHLTKK